MCIVCNIKKVARKGIEQKKAIYKPRRKANKDVYQDIEQESQKRTQKMQKIKPEPKDDNNI